MKWLLIMIATLTLPAAGALAGPDPAPNGLGIYFDQAANTNCSDASPSAPVRAYLIATNVTAPSGLSGWECRILIDNYGGDATYTVLGQYLNVLTPPMFSVGLTAAIPRSTCIPLARISISLGGSFALLGLAPSKPSSFGGLSPGYAVGDNPGRLIAFTPSGNVPWFAVPNGFVVAGINAGPDCPVEGEQASWSKVKTLFR
jgi:hypothetical protein